ncbi:MAG: septum formation initiator, partial [Actinobacteria bacterium]|nr:septum formation initiator [Actinomycetota bacterium]
VLAVDEPAGVDAEALVSIVEAAAQAGPVVLDLARWASAVRSAALAGCDLAVLVTPAEVRAVTASAAVAGGLDPARTAAVVRGAAAALPASRIGALLGLPVLGELGHEPAGRHPGGLDPGRFRRRTVQLAGAVLCRAAGAAGQVAA